MLKSRVLLPAFASAVVLESALETFAHGSPVRWWVAGVAAVYGGVTALCWRRTSWQARTISSLLMLAGMLAVTAWLPGGIEKGVRLFGLTTSTLLTWTAAIGVALGAVTLAAHTRWSRLITAAIYGLGVYGAVAFIHGAVTGVPMSALLSGASLWRPLPIALQGSVVGGLIVLPMALLFTAARAGLRRPREGGAAWALQQAAALAAALAIVIAPLPLRRSGTQSVAAERRASPAATSVTNLPNNELALSLRALQVREEEGPRDRWDPAYVVEQVGGDAQALTEWVREHTHLVPYRGALRGATGVLLDRQGNSLDRSLLLAKLLTAAGHTVRLARRSLTANQAAALLRSVVPNRANTAADVTAVEHRLETVALEHRLPGSGIEAMIRGQASAMQESLAMLDRTVNDQTPRLLAAVSTRHDARSAREDEVSAALREHWWVQVRDAETWRDLDLLMSDAAPAQGEQQPEATYQVDQLDASLFHQISVRVVAEQLSNGIATTRPLLEHVVIPARVIGQPIVLQFWPTDWPAEFRLDVGDAVDGFINTALARHRWAVMLTVAGEPVAHAIINDQGNPETPSGNPFGGLGSAMSRMYEPPSPSGTQQLTAAWIEYEVRTPGSSPRTTRRAVFDLIGESSRTTTPIQAGPSTDPMRLVRSLSLMTRTEILPLAAQPTADFVAHLAAESLVKNRGVLETLAAEPAAAASPDLNALLEKAAPVVTPLYSLAVARLEWSSVGSHLYLDRPSILTRHRFPAVAGNDVVLRDVTDIVANEIAVDVDVADPIAVRIQQGVVDTNLEALLQIGSSPGLNTATAFATSREWMTLTPQNRSDISSLQLSADVKHRIARELDEGRVIVAPRHPVELNSQSYTGWWRIDPRSGDTLGVAANGWGQSLTERSVMMHPVLEMAKTFTFEYAFCQAVPQALNLALPFFKQHRDVLPWVDWLGPIDPRKDAQQLYQANRRECMLGAMIMTGITATLPLVLTVIRSRQALRFCQVLCFAAGTLITTPTGAVAIEQLKLGDAVLARDPETGRQGYKTVTQVFASVNRPMVAVTVRNGGAIQSTLRVTPEHPFWAHHHGWLRADELEPGHRLSTSNHDVVEVVSTSATARGSVFNLAVDDFHTFFAGPERIWVHNNNCIPQRVLTRINLANGPTRFTPVRASGEPVSAGFEHVLQGHFGRAAGNNRSVFSVSPDQLRNVLQSGHVISAPVTTVPMHSGTAYVRTVDVTAVLAPGQSLGVSSLNRGGGLTNVLRVFTDEGGNLISAFPW
jgi:hypothetical protein